MKKGSFILLNRLQEKFRTKFATNAASPCLSKKEDSGHFSPVPDIRRVKTLSRQIQTAAVNQRGSIVLKKAAAENLLNGPPSGGKFFTAAVASRIAPLPSGTSPWQKNAPNATPNFCWKKRQKN